MTEMKNPEIPEIPRLTPKPAETLSFSVALYLGTGQIIMTSTVPDEETADRLAGMVRGMGAVSWLRDPLGLDFYVDGGEYRPMPARPSPLHVFDWAAKAWMDPALDELRAVAWGRIKRAREAAMLLPVETPMGAFDADPESVVKLTAVLASLPYQHAGWAVDWTLADNTVATLDAPTFGAVATAVLAYGDEVHQIGRALRAQLDEATTPEAVEAVRWPAPPSPGL